MQSYALLPKALMARAPRGVGNLEARPASGCPAGCSACAHQHTHPCNSSSCRTPQVTWNPPASGCPADYYTLTVREVLPAGELATQQPRSYQPTALSYDLAGLTPGSQYHIVVRVSG